MKNTTNNEEGCVEEYAELPGSLRTRLVGIVSDDNAQQEEAFDPEDQADRLANAHFDEISKHDEFAHMMVRKALRQTSGTKAANGSKMLTDAYDMETGRIHLIVTDDMTICVNDQNVKKYVPLRLASIADLKNSLERKQEKAEKEVYLAKCMEMTVAALVDEMTAKGKTTLGEVLSDEEFKL